MNANINRREFVKRCAVTGAGILVIPSLAKTLHVGDSPAHYELCSVTGDRCYENTVKAVDTLGGMRRFVQPGSTVGILINSHFGTAGTYTNPDIPLAVVSMALAAGARQITTLRAVQTRYWQRSALYPGMKTDVDRIMHSDEMTEVAIEKGKSLKRAEVSKALLSCDVFINMPIIKDHEGTRFTCTLKNMMGACSESTCRRFHFGDSAGLFNLFKGAYNNIELLAQSIADVNLIRQPDLSVVDATVILATNGPSGPGELRRPREVIASTNCLAADMYAVRHLGLQWEDLPVITFARQHGYGPQSLKDVAITAL